MKKKFKAILVWLLSLIFLLSFLLLGYSVYQLYVEHRETRLLLKEWEELLLEEVETEDELNVDHLVRFEGFSGVPTVADPYVGPANRSLGSEVKESVIVGRDQLRKGALIGKLSFPKLNYHVPIIHGTDNAQLAKGVGHYIGSAFPGEKNHTVLAGHRETALRRVERVEVGDEVVVQTLEGTFVYTIDTIYIVDADDRGVIVPKDEAVITLVTCYPFNFVGPAPQRYILQGTLKRDI